MKRIVLGALIAILSLGLPQANAQQDESRLHKILKTGVLRMGVTGDWNPMTFRNPETKKLQGFDIDWGTELAKDLGVKIEFVPTDWKSLISGIVSDKYDISNSASLTPGRAKSVGFTEHYYELGTVPLSLKKNVARFNSWADINKPDVVVASTMGTVQEQQAKEYFPDAKHKVIEAPARDYQEVLVGRADVHITSNVEAVTLSATYPEMAVVPVKGKSMRPLGALVPQNDQIWINYMNHWVKAKKTLGFFKALEAKWLTPEMGAMMKK